MHVSGNFNVVLYQPEIPQNAGAVLRTCATTDSTLHLIGPLGFRLDAAGIKRAGMDYREWGQIQRWDDWTTFQTHLPESARLFIATTKATKNHTACTFKQGDWLLFGSEGSGIPPEILTTYEKSLLRIPMMPRARSLNLAQSVAVVLFEALRQIEFPHMN